MLNLKELITKFQKQHDESTSDYKRLCLADHIAKLKKQIPPKTTDESFKPIQSYTGPTCSEFDNYTNTELIAYLWTSIEQTKPNA
jgi:hypothetical protein